MQHVQPHWASMQVAPQKPNKGTVEGFEEMRFPFRIREKACYIKLRRLDYSVNTIATAFGRSTSVIHRVLARHGLTRNDLRKLPRRTKMQAAMRQRFFIFNGFLKWLLFAKGELEKPP